MIKVQQNLSQNNGKFYRQYFPAVFCIWCKCQDLCTPPHSSARPRPFPGRYGIGWGGSLKLRQPLKELIPGGSLVTKLPQMEINPSLNRDKGGASWCLQRPRGVLWNVSQADVRVHTIWLTPRWLFRVSRGWKLWNKVKINFEDLK